MDTDDDQASVPIDDRYEHAQTQEPQLPSEEQGNISYDKESYNPTQSFPDIKFHEFSDYSAQRECPTSSVRVPSIPPLQLDLPRPEPQPFADAPNQISRHAFSEEHAVVFTQASGPHAQTDNHGHVHMPAMSAHSHQPELVNDQVTPQSRHVEAIRHGSSRDGSHRVIKSRRKPRTYGPISHSVRGQHTAFSVEESLEHLRVAVLAKNFRVQHENSTITKQHEAEVAELRRTIDSQIRTIAEQDKIRHDLRRALGHLTDKAKANQRFVTGLQQDYENLQTAATIFQKQSKKTLREKITELDSEKCALQQEFEDMTDKLVASQRKMKSTLDDIYVQYVISESKRKDLVEKLGKQDVELEEAGRKRDDMEKQLLSGIQNIPHRLFDSSDALTKNLELLQISLDKATAHDNRNNQLRDCLEALQTLRSTPVLTTEDIKNMEGTLGLVHERQVRVLPYGVIIDVLICNTV
jgi:uncharacterized protein YihD (DUF1040 family)